MQLPRAQNLCHRPEHRPLGQVQRVELRRRQHPASPLRLHQVHLGDAPALIHQPESLAILIKLQRRIAADQPPRPNGEMLQHLGLLERPNRAVGQKRVGRQVRADKRAEDSFNLRYQLLHRTGNADRRTMQGDFCIPDIHGPTSNNQSGCAVENRPVGFIGKRGENSVGWDLPHRQTANYFLKSLSPIRVNPFLINSWAARVGSSTYSASAGPPGLSINGYA